MPTTATASHSDQSTADASSFDSCSFPSELGSSSIRPNVPEIAIVGMTIEFPGAEDNEHLWTLLNDGVNTIERVPPSRFNASLYSAASDSGGRSMNTSMGNFLRNPDVFDNVFFQISPREARSMDPQQRVLLRIAHGALENAGYSPKATPTFDPETFATFIGVATNDYVQNLRDDVDVYYSTGTLPAFLSGRISYAFGFGGPSMVLDTACSSSLVAIHQACRALSAGDCNAALAGGVNIITSPDMYLGLARGHFLSGTGQCRPWDASADGYCRSEGCGLFVLKRLEDAVAENDRILAVIRGTEVNQSGNARSITHPHVPAQTSLYQKLVASADADPLDVSVAECHGTGTQAGDPAELEAIRKVFAVGRTKENPLHITSIKANLGHAEAASGAASLAKLVLMMQHRTIPRHISFKELNPRIPDLSVDNVCIDTEAAPWPCVEGKARLALLTNFGAAGSNSALILEEYPAPPRVDTVSGSLVLGLSCKSAEAAEERRQAYVSHMGQAVHDDASLQDFACSATARRQVHGYRLAVSGSWKEELLASLQTAQVVKVQPADKVVFVFSGQGSQYLGMGRDLSQSLPAFSRTVDACHEKLVASGNPGILDVIKGLPSPVGDASLQFRSLQAALFVLEYALARVWMSWGVQPSAVVGHSFGEFAALVIAGVLTLDDALRVVARRAEVIAAKCNPGRTGMTSVRRPVEEFASLLGRGAFSRLEVCCYNSATSFAVGGDLDQLQHFEALCASRDVRFTRLDVPFAYHSAAMDPVLADLEGLSWDIKFSPPKIPVLSNVTGALIQPGDASVFGAGYLARHCRQPARFQQGIASLVEHLGLADVAAFIEVGPHPTTLPLLRDIQANDAPALLPSLRKTAPGMEMMCAALAQMYCTSVPVDWRKVFADLAPGAQLVDLPAYPFAQTRFWVPYQEHSRRKEDGHSDPTTAQLRFSLLDRYVRSSLGDSGVVFETDLGTLAELIEGHRVADVPLCPASVYVELATAAVIYVLQERRAWTEEDALDIVDAAYPKPLVYVPGRQERVCVEVTWSERSDGGAGSFTVSSSPGDRKDTQAYCQGSFKKTTVQARLSKFSHPQALVQREVEAILRADCPGSSETFGTRTVYDLLFPSIVAYSDIYRTIQTITVNASSSTAHAIVQLSKSAPSGPFAGAHPVFVDTLFHVAGFLVNFTRGMNARDAYICTRADKVQVLPTTLDLAARYGVYAAVTRDEEGVVAVDVYAIEVDDPRKRIVARLKRVCFRRVGLDGFKRALQAAAEQSPVANTLSRDTVLPSPLAHSTPKQHPSPSLLPVPDLERAVLRVIAETAGIPERDVRPDAHLAHLGVDSLMLWEIAVGLRARVPGLARELGARELAGPATVAELVGLVMGSVARCGDRGAVAGGAAEDGGCMRGEDASTVPALKTSEKSPAVAMVDLAGVKVVLSSVLDIPPKDIADDAELQNLGLDSLSSIEARHAFRTRLGIRIDEETLFACRTVRDILDALPRGQPPATLPPPPQRYGDASPDAGVQLPRIHEVHQYQQGHELVRIQRAPEDGPSLPPLILVHDGSGTIGSYERLAPLGRDVWAVRNMDLARFLASPLRVAGGDVETMAKAYAAAWTGAEAVDGERVRIGGECLVGGWSFGGVVALALARHLEAAGVRVKGLVLIDAPAPQTSSALPEWLLQALDDRIAGPKGGPHAPAQGHSGTPGFADQMRVASRALAAYNPEDVATPGLRAVYLQAKESPAISFEAPAEGEELDPHVRAFLTKEGDEWTVPLWGQALEDRMVEVLDIPGDHFRVFARANVDALSEQLKKGLQILSDA